MNERAHSYESEVSLDQLLDTVFRLYGCDFRSYALPFLWRRVMRFIVSEGLEGLAELHNRVLQSEYIARCLLAAISVNVTEMFRDPKFFLTLRREVIPRLASLEFIRVWVIGCADGQEAYFFRELTSSLNSVADQLLRAQLHEPVSWKSV